jgi:hypothetical protein
VFSPTAVQKKVLSMVPMLVDFFVLVRIVKRRQANLDVYQLKSGATGPDHIKSLLEIRFIDPKETELLQRQKYRMVIIFETEGKEDASWPRSYHVGDKLFYVWRIWKSLGNDGKVRGT